MACIWLIVPPRACGQFNRLQHPERNLSTDKAPRGFIISQVKNLEVRPLGVADHKHDEQETSTEISLFGMINL